MDEELADIQLKLLLEGDGEEIKEGDPTRRSY